MSSNDGQVGDERAAFDAFKTGACAVMRPIVGLNKGEACQHMLERIANQSGIKAPTREETCDREKLARIDCKRKSRKPFGGPKGLFYDFCRDEKDTGNNSLKCLLP